MSQNHLVQSAGEVNGKPIRARGGGIVRRIKSTYAGIVKAADLLGIMLTLADYRLNVTEEIGGMIRRHYGRAVFKTEIRGNVRLKEAPSFGKTIFDYDAGSAGAIGRL